MPVAFPITIGHNNITLDLDPVDDVLKDNTREITFIGRYNKLEVWCLCVIFKSDMEHNQKEYKYSYEMSEQLAACRHMATYLGCFKALLSDMNIDFINGKNPQEHPALFIIKPAFSFNTLRTYLLSISNREANRYIHPLFVLQMAINLFSMLTDAHAQNIGLVDITADSVMVGTDSGLYFNGFKMCVPLNEPNITRTKWWVILPTAANCPEYKNYKNGPYHPGTDIFLACTLLLYVMQKLELPCSSSIKRQPKPLKKSLCKQDSSTKTITILTEYLDVRHERIIPVIEQGIKYDINDRPSAEKMLRWFEFLRFKSLEANVAS